MTPRTQWSQEKFDLLFPADFYVNPGADFGPFGSDAGWDLFEELQRRRGSARRIVRAAIAIDEDPDEVVSNAEDGDDVAEALILGAAFSVLRLSGQIDPEGLAWVRAVLRRWQDRDGGCPEADTILADLQRFESIDPTRLAKMDVDTLRDHLGSPTPAPLTRADTPTGLPGNWFFMHADIPEPTTTLGRWGSNTDASRDPLYRALTAAGGRLDGVVRQFNAGRYEPPPGHILRWFSQCSPQLGADFSLSVWILIGRARPRRNYRRTRNERSISVPMRLVEDDLDVAPAVADTLVLGALEDAAVFLAKKEGLEAPAAGHSPER